jgi:hypothetical protein
MARVHTASAPGGAFSRIAMNTAICPSWSCQVRTITSSRFGLCRSALEIETHGAKN